MTVRAAASGDAWAIAEIYNHYIEHSHATFETEKIDAGEMFRRIAESCNADYPFLVDEIEDKIRGFAYGRRYRPRAAYAHSIETSVYIEQGFEGRGIASQLYTVLLPEIVSKGFHAIIAGISLPNGPSVKLHEKFGFEKVAHFREVGFKFGRWIDVGYWEKIVNRR